MSDYLVSGRIIMLRDCYDPQFGQRDERRFVVIRVNKHNSTVEAVGCSGEHNPRNPMHVPLASGTQFCPHPKTRFKKPTWAICDTWFWTIQESRIDELNYGFCGPKHGYPQIVAQIANRATSHEFQGRRDDL